MKNKITLAVISTFLFTTSVFAEKSQLKEPVTEFSIGAVYTDLDEFDYSGQGLKLASKITFGYEHIPVDFYGQLSYSATEDDGSNKLMLDETEITFGIEYAFNESWALYFEDGYLKQNLDNNTNGLWRETEEVYRLGSEYIAESYSIAIAAEYRDEQDEFGFSSSLLLGEHLDLSYIKVGEYQSIGLAATIQF